MSLVTPQIATTRTAPRTLALWLTSILLVCTFSFLPGASYPMKALDGIVLNGTIRHLVAYSVVTFWPARRETVRVTMLWAGVTLLIGVLVEVLQGLFGRDSELNDIFANAAGIAAGCTAGWQMQRAARPQITNT
jgi:hypothetical protein